LSGTTCALLQQDGTFHSEMGDRYSTRVYEGKISGEQVTEVEAALQKLAPLSQRQIEEPLIHGAYDTVDVAFTERGRWRALLFQTTGSQAPYKRSLEPLLRWMENLRKLSHQEFSEEAGKRNCLPPRNVTLIPRDALTPPATIPGVRIRGSHPALTVRPPTTSLKVTPLLQLSLLNRTSSGAEQDCALVATNGGYRFEAQIQSAGRKPVKTLLASGQLAGDDLQKLQSLLESPPLAKMRHHEPPDSMPLNIMGSVLELYIATDAGVQELVLTDSVHRSTFFYPGDGDIKSAAPLLGFMREHIESKATPANAAERNGCTELP
jgi:hypothetical protein